MTYEVDGEQYVAIATGGNQSVGSAFGDAVWSFSLNGQLRPLWPPPPPPTVSGPTGPIAEGVDTIKIGDNNVEYAYFPSRIRIKDMVKNNFPDCLSRSILTTEEAPDQGVRHGSVFSRC